MSKHIQRQVDQLLLDQGEYLPLEFLLQEGRLFYTDYEAWRNGELETLSEALFGDPEQIRQQLTDAESYLQQLGWQSELIRYSVWNRTEASFQALCFSISNGLDECFHRRYFKPQDQPQLDLFTDSTATSLVNSVTRALCERNSADARCYLERLYDAAPDHVRLGELERLVEATEGLGVPVTDARAELQYLQETIVPLADTLLANNSRNMLVPLWRRLSIALQDQAFLVNEPELHRSFTASQAMDWSSVQQAVEGEPGWQNNFELLLRHARACESQHEEITALMSWFMLCWQFPGQCDDREPVSHELRQHWYAFLELDPELPIQSFPSWLLVFRPGLVKRLPDPDLSCEAGLDDVACPGSYITLFKLQKGQSATNHADVARKDHETGANNSMALRSQLKHQDSELFQYYLTNMTEPA